jgi:hypothetical protein
MKHTIAAEFVSPLMADDFDSFDLTDPDVTDDLEMYYDWLFEVGVIKTKTLLNAEDDARIDICEVTGRMCECFDVEITG